MPINAIQESLNSMRVLVMIKYAVLRHLAEYPAEVTNSIEYPNIQLKGKSAIDKARWARMPSA